MKKEAISHGVLEDLANRNDNWDKLDGVIDQVVELDESRPILKNEIVNGDFSDGISGWFIAASSTGQVLNKILKLTIVQLSGFGNQFIRQNTEVKSNQKYYIKYSIKPKFSRRVGYYFNGAYIQQSASPIANEWNVYSVIVPVETVSTTTLQLITHATDSLYSIGDVWEVGGVCNINLTQTFGAGNEPTKEEMDTIMDTIGYFNGTHTITSKEQFNILLKMVRENALATTSLGGGF